MSGQISFVSPAEVNAWRAGNNVVIVDVREPNEWEQVHIPGATLVPLSTFDAGQIPDATGKELVFHCKSGVRCGMAAEKAIASGFTGKIARMEGGILGWMRAGFETEQG
jgi:rhodanese-related sulfurtransferase